MTDAPKVKWYEDLIANINNLAEEFGLDDLSTGKMRDFTVTIAKEQYKRGNKSGAAWAFKQADAKATA